MVASPEPAVLSRCDRCDSMHESPVVPRPSARPSRRRVFGQRTRPTLLRRLETPMAYAKDP
jgi:hypothetical protein